MSAEARETREIELIGTRDPRVGATKDDMTLPRLRDMENAERPCALAGRVLEAGALVEIVSFIAQSGWRGELRTTDGNVVRSLFFDEGQLVAAESNAPEERLRAVLVKHHLMTPEEVAACEAITVTRALRFGEAVVELGYASREAVFGWLAVQVEAIALAVLRIDSGAFAFFRGYEEARLSFRRKHDASALVERVIRGIDDVRWFRSKIRASTDIPLKAPGRTLPAHDPLGVFAAIDGTKSVGELARTLGASELDITRAVYQHMATGHATVTSQPLDAREIVGVYNRAIHVLVRELDAMDEGDNLRAELAKFAEATPERRPDFVDAPADDGTLDAEAIAERFAKVEDKGRASEQLARWLYDYASYALYLARPHLQRRYDAGDTGPRVSQHVADLLEPLAPVIDIVVPPSAKTPRVTMPAPPSAAPSSGSIPEAAPLSSSTMRMRRALVEAIPGIDPSRTVRIAPFSGAPAGPPSSGTMRSRPTFDSDRMIALSSAPPVRARRPEAPVRAPAAPRTHGKVERLRVPVIVAAALMAGMAFGWAAHRRAETTPHAAPSAQAVPRAAETVAAEPALVPTEPVVAPAPPLPRADATEEPVHTAPKRRSK